jgi:multicomponent Na+:H+ antiporter subunit B
MRLDLILRVMSKLLLPFMLVFALYVQFHGDFGPGGGFQAGVIAAGMIILYALIFGLPAAKKIVPQGLVEIMIPLGVAIYAGTGIVGMLKGGNFLEFTYLAQHPPHGHHLGVFSVELGVLVTVASTMLAIFYAFAGRDPS